MWSALDSAGFSKLQGSDGNVPLKIFFTHKSQDGYLESQSQEYVWGLKLTPDQEQQMRAARPDLFAQKGAGVEFNVFTMGFVIFSPICPHLGCHYNWDQASTKFICPCHGSVYDKFGKHLAGPAPRGLDPLPLREQSGKAEITWIQYETAVPDRVIIAYS
ncbi:MAG: ubiquinol-cytochrome c reductase iron-sulfur subunit [bacterium]|nr:ubiquinol-cytochrome c reductase iron-sulfur subunit [bacterium]